MSDRFDATGRPIRSLHRFHSVKEWKAAEVGRVGSSGLGIGSGGHALEALVKKRTTQRRAMTPGLGPGLGTECHLNVEDLRRIHGVTPPLAGFTRESKITGTLPLQERAMTPGSGIPPSSPIPLVMTPLPNISAFGKDGIDSGPKAPQVLSGEDRLQYFSWVESFATENQDFKSINIWADLVLCQVMEVTKGRVLPCPLRTAVCCYVLDQLVKHRSRSGLPACLSVVKTELFNAVYTDHRVDLTKGLGRELPTTETVPPASRSCYSHHTSLVPIVDVPEEKIQGGRRQFQNLVEAGGGGQPRAATPHGGHLTPKVSPTFIDLKMFVAETEKLRKQAHQLRSAVATTPGPAGRFSSLDSGTVTVDGPGASAIRPPHQVVAALSGSVKALHRFTKLVVFRAWRGTMVRKTPEDVAGMWLKMALQTAGKHTMQHFFRKWMQWPAAKRVNERSYRLQLIIDNLRREAQLKENTIENLTAQLQKMRAAEKNTRDKQRESPMPPQTPEASGITPPDTPKPFQPMTPGETAFHVELPPNAIGTPQPLHLCEVQSRGRPKSGKNESSPFAKVESIDPLEALRLWATHLLERSRHPEISLKSLEVGLCDGKVFAALLGTLFPHSGVDQSLTRESPYKRVEEVLFVMRSEGLPEQYVQSHDIVNGSIANTAVLAWIFQRWYFQHLHEFDEIGNLDLNINRSVTSVEELAQDFNIHSSAPQAFHILSQRIEQGVQCILLAKLAEHSESAGAVGGGLPGSGQISDLTEFTSVSATSLNSIAGSGMNTIAEIGDCELVLRQHYTELKKIYEFYRGPQSQLLPVKGLWKFVTDTRLTSRAGITRQFIQSILGIEDGPSAETPPETTPRSNVQASATPRSALKKTPSNLTANSGVSPRRVGSQKSLLQPTGTTGTSSGTTTPQTTALKWPSNVTLTKTLFVEALIQFAAIHVLSLGKHLEKGLIAATLEELIAVQILPRAMSNAKADFKRVCQDQKILDVFAQPVLSKALTRIYRHYSTLDSQGKIVMAKKQFVTMVVQLQLFDRSMKESDIESLFTEVQDEDFGGQDEGGENMDTHEFQEALIALSMFKYPHPMQPISLKIQNFINTVLIPASRNVKKL